MLSTSHYQAMFILGLLELIGQAKPSSSELAKRWSRPSNNRVIYYIMIMLHYIQENVKERSEMDDDQPEQDQRKQIDQLGRDQVPILWHDLLLYQQHDNDDDDDDQGASCRSQWPWPMSYPRPLKPEWLPSWILSSLIVLPPLLPLRRSPHPSSLALSFWFCLTMMMTLSVACIILSDQHLFIERHLLRKCSRTWLS